MTKKTDIPTGQPSARPNLLTGRRMAVILKSIEDGNFTEVAATLAGVSRSTYNHWRRRGENEIRRVDALGIDATEIVDQFLDENWDEEKPHRGLEDLLKNSWADTAFDTEEWPYVIFATLLMRARATFIENTVADIRSIGKGGTSAPNWSALKWLLQTTNPDIYGDKKTVVHEGGETPITLEIPSAEELKARILTLQASKDRT